MFKNYLKVAIKVLLRRKFFTGVSLFGIAFTLFVLLVVTAMMDQSFRPQRPEVDGDRLLMVNHMAMVGPHSTQSSSAGYAFLDRHVRRMQGPEAVAIASRVNQLVSFHDGRRIESRIRLTDGEYWRILDFDFVEGGPFGDDDEAAANRVAVINEATRDRYFGGAAAVGRSIELDGRAFRVVGVVRNVPIMRQAAFSDIWVPISTSKSDSYKREIIGGFMGLILAPSADAVPAIQAEFQRVLTEVELPDPQTYEHLYGGADTYLQGQAREMFSPQLEEAPTERLWALIVGAMLAFMLLPAINLVNLNLSRILERSSEIGVRKAFGASSRALVLQLVIENLVLTAIGGAVGLALAATALAIINRIGFIPYSDFTMSPRAFVYGLGLVLVFGLLSGVYPAWRMSRLHPAQVLGGRSI
jgi:putative ABC transport system permease protein